jgi:hypothetical protein
MKIKVRTREGTINRHHRKYRAEVIIDGVRP